MSAKPSSPARGRFATSLRAGVLGLLGLAALCGARGASAQSEAASDVPLPQAAIQVLNQLSGGPHPGYRANHAKGILVVGSFAADKNASRLCAAAQFKPGQVVPILVRFSNTTGVPNLPDADPHASPHGMAIRFQLPDGTSTDIVSISSNGFPVATPEAFVGLLSAIAQSGPDAAQPTPIDRFMASHPIAAKWAATPRPAPVSFGTLAFYGVNAFRFTNAKGHSHFIRYRIMPVLGEQALGQDEAGKVSADYLLDDLSQRLARGTVKFRLLAQVAQAGDPTDDGSQVWPESRKLVALGTITLKALAPDQEASQKGLMFNPLSLTEGIAPSQDPILLFRPGVYALSYAQRNH